VSRLEQGELDGGEGRPGGAAAARLARAADPEGHELAEGVAEQEDGYQRAVVRFTGCGPSLAVAAGALCAPAERPQVPPPARLAVHAPYCRSRPSGCAVSTYLDQVVKLGMDGETGGGTGR
jgi:hypothetical protein